MTKYKSSKTQETHSRGNTADMGIGNKRLPLLPPCKKLDPSQKCNKMEGGGGSE